MGNLALTGKEAEVVKLILEGKSNLQIATQMGVTINTVKTHVARILKKKNVKNRVQLITKQLTKK